MKRSTSVTTFGVVFIALGVGALLFWGYLFFSEEQGLMSFIHRIAVPAIPHLLGIAAGIGILGRLRWALWLTLIVAGVNVIWKLIRLITVGGWLGSAEWLGSILVMGWGGLILWFFLRRTVREEFGRER